MNMNSFEKLCKELEPPNLHYCPDCSKSFRTVSSMNVHIRRLHKKESPTCTQTKLRCPIAGCESYYFKGPSVRRHINVDHNINLEMEVLTFPDNKAFYSWRENIHEETKCLYVSTGSPVRRNQNKCRVHYFNCIMPHCKRPKRNQQNMKYDEGLTFCPSTLKVSIADDNTYTVEYHKTHVGPNGVLNDTVMLTRDVDDHDGISEDVPLDQILDEARRSCLSETQRTHLQTQSDYYKLTGFEPSNLGLLCGDEFSSVGSWVGMMKTLGEYSPVAFYKRKGEKHEELDSGDFMIVIFSKLQREISKKFLKNNICVDSISGSNPSDLCLTSVLAIEESSLVFPVAFCISSKTDVNSMALFFQTVKDKIGTFDSPVFMSNGEPSFHIAWEKVMASDKTRPINRLVCSWDIDSSWRKSLSEISGSKNKMIVYKTLLVLLQESDVDVFQEALVSFLDELREDVSTKKFSEYFCADYFHSAKMWAFCYRQDLGISTDMYLDTMHQILKNYFLDKKTTKLCRAVQGLLKVMQYQILRMPSDFIEYDSNCWFYKMYEGHQKSLKVTSVFQLNACNWSIQSPVNNQSFIVTRKGTCSLDCNLKCSICDVCVHTFCCTCDDNLLLYNICQHIHACARQIQKCPIAVSSDTESVPVSEATVIVQQIVESTDYQSSVNLDLKLKLNYLKSLLDYEYTEQAVKQIGDTLDLMISFLQK